MNLTVLVRLGVSFEIKKQLVLITESNVFKKDDLAIIRNIIEACNQYLDTVSLLKLSSIIFKSNEIESAWEDLNFDTAMK